MSINTSLASLPAIIILTASEIQALFAPKVVQAWCVLHNVCAAEGEILEDAEEGKALGKMTKNTIQMKMRGSCYRMVAEQ